MAAIYEGVLSLSPVVFFFKQKTAYELGLGIPAEPLFRSTRSCFPFIQEPPSGDLQERVLIRHHDRSEERRVGKECRPQGSQLAYKNNKDSEQVQLWVSESKSGQSTRHAELKYQPEGAAWE